MNCPVCNVPLTMTDRQGVEIDYCQRCRGVWLDRGELDKILERSMGGGEQHYSSEPRHENREHFENRGHHHEDQSHYKQHDDYKYKKKKKESFLSDLFDF